MALTTTIEWTRSTWNPVTGCTAVSPGCQHCYARRMARRLQGAGCARYARGFAVTLHEDLLDLPLHWRRPRLIFANSMSDLFHDDVPLGFIRDVFDTMKAGHWHVFQVLTKRAERLASCARELDWSPNIWIGVTVESRDYRERIDALRNVPSANRFVSFEPLIGAVGAVNLEGIGWAIVGGESGPGARLVRYEWVTELREQCRRARVPFFFKQWGGRARTKAGRMLDGRVWDEMPSTIAGLAPSRS